MSRATDLNRINRGTKDLLESLWQLGFNAENNRINILGKIDNAKVAVNLNQINIG